MNVQSIRSLTITTMVENYANAFLLGQWGLSFFLEITDAKEYQRKIVFDTGKDSRALLQNMKLLKKDPKNLDCIVLSHGHLDHTATTAELVKSAGGTKVYAHPHTFLPRNHVGKDGKKRRIGVPEGEGIAEIEKAGGEIILTTKPVEIVPGLWTTGQIPRRTFENVMTLPKGNKLIINIDGKQVNDKILDDQSLCARVKNVGVHAITGCAHSGLINTLKHVQKITGSKQIAAVVGGTHLVDRSDKYIQQTITGLNKFGLNLISPCHCTGFKAQARLWEAFPNSFVFNYSGRVIEAGKEPQPRII